MKAKVYIDGHVGTVGLRIRDWMAARSDVELLEVPEAHRKDAQARKEHLLASDLGVLCLPDDAAREALDWVGNGSTRLLDASSAHRVSEGWIYGLPELKKAQRKDIAEARLVTNPGCYPSAFILLTRPLIDAELLSANTPLSVHGLSGYSGGGRGLIERWEDPELGLDGLPFEAPYALERVHKHIPEMHAYSGLATSPQFIPAVGPFRCGMRVQVPLHADMLLSGANAEKVWQCLAERYEGEPYVAVQPLVTDAVNEHSLDPTACNDTNRMDLYVIAHPSGHILLVATLDNLGKGASGVAIQNLNLMLGLGETTGLPS